MSDFSFSATAECDLCGAYLSSSDEECDHDGESVDTHVFRRFNGGRESMQGVESTIGYKWDALEEKLGDEWKEYFWLGTREEVERMLKMPSWESVEDLPVRMASVERLNTSDD